ncbi:MAG: PQQ-binding-like beta-propeller repeat protein [Planctomycetes bacterium]|nr:PQQ-binding-like beta-propeller repeat protein [Planctomycetota bacterium]
MRRLGCTFVLLVTPALGQVATQPAPTTPERQAARLARELELPERRTAAVAGLCELGAPALAPLLAQMRHPDPTTARVAAQVLVEFGHDALPIVPKLQALAAGKDATAPIAAWALARLPHRGTFLVPSMEEGLVRELDGDGKEIWKSAKVGKPWSASMLADGHLLVADVDGAAREYDAEGKVVWEWTGKHCYTAERLLDGNTLLAEYGSQRVVEVDAKGEVVWQVEKCSPLFARRLPDGRTFFGNFDRGTLHEVDRTGVESWTLEGTANTYIVRRLRDGTLLHRQHNVAPARVRDHKGTELRTVPTFDVGTDVALLPDGSIQCGQGYVRRCDADGKERWKVDVGGWVGQITLR